MQGKRVIPTLAATVACALGVAVPAASASTDVQTASSANWSGYVVGGSSSTTNYKSVSGSWVAPTAKCTSGQGYSSFWVGLGGAGSDSSATSDAGSWSDSSGMDGSGSTSSTSLEQAGTEADCNADGSATYSAWYELVPAPPVKVNLAVHPGDHITSKVTVDSTSATIQLTNSTTGGSFEKTLPVTNPNVSSAEWIAEAPSTCSQGVSNCTPLSLADFGTVQFSGASATTTDGHTGTISDSNWQTASVTLSPSASQDGFSGQFASYDSSGSAGATPSSLSSDGSSFSVAWSSDGSASSTSGSSGADGSSGGYSDPSGGYGDPSAGYGDPSAGYGDPTAGYGDPTAGYGDPTAGYGDPTAGDGGYGSYGGGDGWGGYGGYGYAYVPGLYSY